MPNSFDNLKDLLIVITLGTGTFGSSNANTISIQGFRATVDIDHGGGQMFAHLKAQIYGVSQSDMNAITVVQFQSLSQGYIPNTITVTAIDGDQQTLVFSGNIINAWGNYQAQPEVFLQLDAQAGIINRLQPIPPTSYSTSVDVAAAISQIVTAMNNSGATPPLTFQNNGVTAQLPAMYLPGTGIDQIQKLVQASGIWWGIDATSNTLWIAPQNGSRGGVTATAGSSTSNSVDFGLEATPASSAAAASVPLISPDTDLMGYPSFDAQGYLNFQCKFNPAITFLGQIQVQSSIPKANGQWVAVGIAHKMESQKVDGAWFSTIRANASGLVPIQ